MNPTAAFTSTVPVSSSRPLSVTRPASRESSPHTMEIVVVLPAPFGPSSPYVSPAAIVNPTPSTATRSPYDLRSPSQSLAVQHDGRCMASRYRFERRPCRAGIYDRVSRW